jgi:CMP-N,N'-diacetyllegionaminic acid synthase
MNVLAIVPARGGSKGIPNKNLAMCGGKPLIEWTFSALGDSRLVDGWILTSDDSDIEAQFMRWNRGRGNICPAHTIDDTAQIEDRLDEIIQKADPGITVLLQPTSPVRTGKQIDEAIEQLIRNGADSLVSVVLGHAFRWRKAEMWEECGPWIGDYGYAVRPRRQDMPAQYEENGSIYVFTREHWERTHNRLGGKTSLYVMPEESKIQIDSPFDLWMAEQILQRQHALV